VLKYLNQRLHPPSTPLHPIFVHVTTIILLLLIVMSSLEFQGAALCGVETSVQGQDFQGQVAAGWVDFSSVSFSSPSITAGGTDL
jgi:hypothetical protein